MSTSAIISLIFTIGFWILFLYVVIRARKKRKARQAEATAQAGISKTFFGRAISSLGRFFSLLFLVVVGIMMILGTVGFIVSDNKTDEVAETGQETATTETNAEAKTYYVKSGARKSKKVKKTFLRGGEVSERRRGWLPYWGFCSKKVRTSFKKHRQN